MTPTAIVASLFLAGAPVSDSGVEEKLEKKTEAQLPFEISGRFEARESVGTRRGETRGPWTGETSLARAEVGIGWKHENVKVVVEADLADEAEIKDAWARLDLGAAAVRAGRFKMASTGLESESSWTLPTATRGDLHDALEDALQISGRRTGVSVSTRSKSKLRPEAMLAAWQALGADGDPRRGGDSDLFGQCAGARASISPGPVTAGAFAAWRSVEPYLGSQPERHWAGGADVALDLDAGLRAWVEGFAGSSPLTFEADDARATFAGARAVLGWKIGGAKKDAAFVEPFAMAGALDPDLETRADLMTEIALGVNAGRWDRWRVQLQVAETRLESNLPASIAERAEIADRRTALLQMGVSF